MIDEQLLKLTTDVKSEMKNNPKDVKILRKQYFENILPLLDSVITDFSPEEKIAFFDKIAASQVEALKRRVQGCIHEDNDYFDSDELHLRYEEISQGLFGEKIFDTLNEFENILP